MSDGIPSELIMIKKLIELGVSFESKDIEGISALEMALNYASRGGYHY
jgi:ankyrin repeat protein